MEVSITETKALCLSHATPSGFSNYSSSVQLLKVVQLSQHNSTLGICYHQKNRFVRCASNSVSTTLGLCWYTDSKI